MRAEFRFLELLAAAYPTETDDESDGISVDDLLASAVGHPGPFIIRQTPSARMHSLYARASFRERFVRGGGHRGASSAAEALSLIRVWRPNLMIVDIMMPGMTGLDLCEYLRGRATTRDIPIIAYSGYPMQHASSDLYDRAFLKPADIGELVLAIRALLARKP